MSNDKLHAVLAAVAEAKRPLPLPEECHVDVVDGLAELRGPNGQLIGAMNADDCQALLAELNKESSGRVSGAIREVDELNDYGASTVVPSRVADTEPAPPPAEPNEIGPVAGIVRIAGEELLEALESEEDIVNANRELLEGRPLSVEENEKWTRLFHEIMHESNKRLAPKGIVLLAACPEPNGLGGVLTGCDRASLDAASRGIDMPSEDYTVTVTLPARERVDIARSEREEFARRIIGLVVGECISQQAAYRAQQRFFN